jgi:hypothetical protein
MSESQRAYEETEMGRDMRIEKKSSEMYNTLVESEDSPFYKQDRKDLFIFAMGYGRKKAGRREVNANHALFGLTALSDEQDWIIKATAVKHEGDPGVLRDERQVYEIAREYAKAGIHKLHSKYLGPDDTLSELVQDVAKFNNPNTEG